MIRRIRRICFRMTEKEFQRFSPLLQGSWSTMTWSDLVRHSLEEEAKRRNPSTSDNDVRQGILASDTPAEVKPVAKKTRKSVKKAMKRQKNR